MKRSKINLAEIAAYNHLLDATVRAARGKRGQPHIARFFDRLEANLKRLSLALIAGRAPENRYTRFMIRDPKLRIIHAPCFEDRIVHHALVGLAEPRLEQTLVPSTYACRKGKGNLAAVKAAQRAMRRFPWYVKVDIRSYFDSIDQGILKSILATKFKGDGLFDVIHRILGGYHTQPGKGLPIGALTSQHFANLYLDGMDRFLLEEIGVSAHVRYMDDSLWWVSGRERAKSSLRRVREWLGDFRRLSLKSSFQINQSRGGVTFCGFRILPWSLRLSPRRRQRFADRRKAWERAYRIGLIDASELQRAYAGVHAITAHADSCSWRRDQLRRYPPLEV